MAKKVTRKVAMSLMAHPDDCEFGCAGTLALLAKKGWEIHIVSATPGDCGSATDGPIQISATRRAENTRSAAIIGATYHCLELRDLYVTFDQDSIRRALTLTRAIGPTLMFTHSLNDYMMDHEMTARLARTASFGYFVPNACNGPIPPAPGSGVPHLYYADPAGLIDYEGQRPQMESYVVIDAVMSTKMRMLKAHASQRQWLYAHYGVDEYVRMMKEGGALRGEEVNAKYAEAFRQHKGQGYPKDCLLARELGELVRQPVF
jgi:LmbE family N-acetylglucosaminyl deacetylase